MTFADVYFCELVPLYALDILDAQARQWIEAQIAECPELAEEAAAFQAAVAAIAYSTPEIPVDSDVKRRLFQQIGCELPNPLPTPAPTLESVPPDYVVRSHDLKWRPYGAPGILFARLHIDRSQRELVALVRAEAGSTYPLHRHANVEEMYMLEGDLVIAGAVYSVGDYIRSYPGSMHSATTTGGCLFFIRSSLDDEFVEN